MHCPWITLNIWEIYIQHSLALTLSTMELKAIAQNEQKQPLTTALRNICRDYPSGGGVLGELLQNADDAGATEVVSTISILILLILLLSLFLLSSISVLISVILLNSMTLMDPII